MRNKLISALATKFEGVEAKTLGRIADNLLHDKTITNDEEVNSAVEEVTFNDILKSYGDSRAAEATKSSVSNYEKKYGLKDGKPAQTDGNDGKDGDNGKDGEPGNPDNGKPGTNPKNKDDKAELKEMFAEMMGAFEKKLEGISTEISSIKKGKVTADRKARFNEVIKSLSDSQKKAYSRTAFDSLSDDDFEQLIDDVTNEVAELTKDNARGSQDTKGGFGPALGGGNHGGGKKDDKPSDAELSEIVSGMKF